MPPPSQAASRGTTAAPKPEHRRVSAFVAGQAQRLRQGTASAAEVMRAMRAHYGRSPCSLRKHASQLRLYLAATQGPKTGHHEQLKLTRDESVACRRHQRRAVLDKNLAVQRVDGEAFLKHMARVLTPPFDKRTGKYELALALMAATGRRTAEIVNGRSRFTLVPSAGAARVVRFEGQLKRVGAAPAFVIPVLVEPQHVVAAHAELRTRQQADVATRDQRSISRRYQSGLRQHLIKHPVYAPSVRQVHDLRGAYAALAYELFDFSGASRTIATMRILGHRRPEETLSYNTFDIVLAPGRRRRAWGKLRVENIHL